MFLLAVMWVGAILKRNEKNTTTQDCEKAFKGSAEPTSNVGHSHFVKS